MAVSAAICIANVSCNANSRKTKESVTDTSTEVSTDKIPYQVVNGYFINNDIDEVPEVVTDQTEFTKCFGIAATMGDNEKPTDIDFDKQFVIVASAPVTYMTTEMTPVSLEKTKEGLVFTCKMTQGEKQTYSTHPFLMIAVDNKNQMPVIVKIMK